MRFAPCCTHIVQTRTIVKTIRYCMDLFATAAVEEWIKKVRKTFFSVRQYRLFPAGPGRVRSAQAQVLGTAR